MIFPVAFLDMIIGIVKRNDGTLYFAIPIFLWNLSNFDTDSGLPVTSMSECQR